MTQSLLRRAGKAVALNAMGNWFGMISGMVSLVVIARLLSPTDFGVFGMVLVAFAIPEMFVSGSLNDSLIQRRDLQPGHVNSVFMQSLILAGIFWLGISLASPLIAGGFGHPELEPMMRFFSITLFMGAFASIPAALLQRDLRFREITIVDILGTLVAAIVGVVCAIYLRSAWALIFMEMSRRTVRLVAFTAITKWRPSVKTSWVETLELTRYNSLNMATRVIQSVESAFTRSAVGAVQGPAALGMFNMATRLLEQAKAAVVQPFAAVALPVASQTQHDLPMLYRAIEGAMKLAALIAYPTFIGAFVIVPVAIPVVFGEQWTPAVPTIQIFFLMGLRTPTSAFNTGVLNGVGRVDWTFKISFISLVLTGALVAATLQISLEAVALAVLAQILITWVIGAYAVKQSIGFPMHRQIVAGSTSLMASVVMAVVVWGVMRSLSDAIQAPIQLLILVGVGVVSYAAALASLAPAFAVRLWRASIMVAKGRRQEAIALVKGGA
ncbi:lipopolysaccharide biosynthesis protein [Hyphomonas sp.]|uniref:lipopolysaccharide biosynthesis protein n=1 Tax=Hyphomonas sp. TaxID=87 RepID=UPI00356B0847